MRALLVRLVILMAALSLSSTQAAVGELNILTRNEWGAQKARAKRDPPIKTGKFEDKTVKAENVMTPRAAALYLTVHHRGVKGDPNVPIEKKLSRFQEFSWGPDYMISNTQIFLGDIPYHYFISYEGQVAEGRELKWSAWSNTNYVIPEGETPEVAITKHVTVVLEGDLQQEQPTPEQLASLEELLYQLAIKHRIRRANILYHAKVVAPGKTICPGANMIKKMPVVIAALQERGLQ
jgi:hypothetical protein